MVFPGKAFSAMTRASDKVATGESSKRVRCRRTKSNDSNATNDLVSKPTAESSAAGQVLDLIKAAPQAALQKLRRCRYFRLTA